MERFTGRNWKGLSLNGKDSNLMRSYSSTFLNSLKVGTCTLLSRLNLKKTALELKELGKKHGPYFLIYAVCIELFEDLLLPSILYLVGKPQLIPVALAFHCEPIAYPLYFAIASLFKKIG